jgi:hypothetical protein
MVSAAALEKMPTLDAQHLIDRLIGLGLVRKSGDAGTGWEISEVGREYSYRRGLARDFVERPTRRTPPSDIEVSVWEGHEGLSTARILPQLEHP